MVKRFCDKCGKPLEDEQGKRFTMRIGGFERVGHLHEKCMEDYLGTDMYNAYCEFVRIRDERKAMRNERNNKV